MPIKNLEERRAAARAYYYSDNAAKLARRVARLQSTTAAKVDALLSSPRLDADAIRDLATRARYPDAALCFVRATGRATPLPILFDPHNMRTRVCRVAHHFGAIKLFHKSGIIPEFQMPELRKLAARNGNARLALALLKELANWNEATREERAAYALGRLVAAWRERMS